MIFHQHHFLYHQERWWCAFLWKSMPLLVVVFFFIIYWYPFCKFWHWKIFGLTRMCQLVVFRQLLELAVFHQMALFSTLSSQATPPTPPPTQGSSCLVSFKPVEQDLIQPKSKGKLVLLFFKFNYFWLLGLHCCMHFSLVSGSGGYSLVVMCRLLFAVASLVAEHRLLEPSGFNNRSSQAVEHRLISCGPQA